MQNELSTHCHKDHNLETDLDVHILEHGIEDLGERQRMEDKMICKLQTHQSNKGGLNLDMHTYGKEMYELWASRNQISPNEYDDAGTK